MPAIITNKFRIHNSEQFFESFSEAAPNVYYLGIGRPQDFTTSTRPDGRTENEGTDSASPTPTDSVVEEFYTFDDLLAVKKITSSDISKVIPRRNWTNGNVYDMYRHDYGRYITGTTTVKTSTSGASNLYDATFYVKTAANRVYKCLDNANGAVVAEEPTTTSPSSTQTTSDGYKWKYMYTLSSSQVANFLSTDFMAVASDSGVQSAALNGAIDTVIVKSAGTGGTDGTHTNIPIRGDGSGGVVSVVVSSGSVSSVTVTTADGCKLFGETTRERDYDQRVDRPQMRLMNEVYKVADLYLKLVPVLAERPVEVHLDISPDPENGSNCVVQQAIGYIRGVCNVEPWVKPLAFAASCAADRYKELASLAGQAARLRAA